ncbi:hypothetical protein AC249_AIPGENE14284 [Exaiptasia diaphana]|nr:hypothetical protein AC249_AIPGENE14284 [Exaiptasia diaphana]
MADEDKGLTFGQKKKSRKRCLIIIAVVVVILVFLTGFLIGYFSRKTSPSNASKRECNRSVAKSTKESREKALETLQNSIDAAQLEENVRSVSGKRLNNNQPRTVPENIQRRPQL